MSIIETLYPYNKGKVFTLRFSLNEFLYVDYNLGQEFGSRQIVVLIRK